MIWTAALGGEACGGCGLVFTRDQALALVTAKALKRCAQCVALVPVDTASVEAVIAERNARWAAEAHAQLHPTKPGQPKAPVLDGFTAVGDVPAAGLNPLLRDTGGIKGIRPTKFPKPFHEVANDPTIARLCAEDNR